MWRRAVSALLIITNCILMTGCWGYKEINDLPIVLGAAIDKISTDEYLLTVEIVKTTEVTSAGGGLKIETLQMTGKTIFDAIRRLIVKNAKFLYWADMKVIIIGKGLAEEEGILAILDMFYRDVEIRAEGRVIIAKNKAADIFKHNQIKDRSVSLHLMDVMDNSKKLSRIYPLKMYEAIDILKLKGKSLILPVLDPKDIDPGSRELSLESGLFKKDKIVGTIIGKEVQPFRLLINEEKGGIRIENVLANGNSKVSYEVVKGKSKIKPIYKDGKFTMKIDLTTNVIIAEVMNYNLDITRVDVRNNMKEQLENTIKHNCQRIISKAQNEYDSDIFGFGELIKNKYPDVWKENEDNWDKVFPNVATEITVKVNFEGSALYSNIIK